MPQPGCGITLLLRTTVPVNDIKLGRAYDAIDLIGRCFEIPSAQQVQQLETRALSTLVAPEPAGPLIIGEPETILPPQRGQG